MRSLFKSKTRKEIEELEKRMEKIGILNFDIRLYRNEIYIPEQKPALYWSTFCEHVKKRVEKENPGLAQAITELQSWHKELSDLTTQKGMAPQLIICDYKNDLIYGSYLMEDEEMINIGSTISTPLLTSSGRGRTLYMHLNLEEINRKYWKNEFDERTLSNKKEVILKHADSQLEKEYRLKWMFRDGNERIHQMEIERLFQDLSEQKNARNAEIMEEFAKTITEEIEIFKKAIGKR